MNQESREELAMMALRLVFVAAFVGVQLLMTSVTFRDSVRRWWRKATSPFEYEPGREPAAWEITRVHDAARRITKEAAEE